MLTPVTPPLYIISYDKLRRKHARVRMGKDDAMTDIFILFVLIVSQFAGYDMISDFSNFSLRSQVRRGFWVKLVLFLISVWLSGCSSGATCVNGEII